MSGPLICLFCYTGFPGTLLLVIPEQFKIKTTNLTCVSVVSVSFFGRSERRSLRTISKYNVEMEQRTVFALMQIPSKATKG